MAKKTGLIFLAVLFGLAVIIQMNSNGIASIPLKVWILAGGLAVAAVASRLRFLWLRSMLLIAAIAYFGFYEGSCLCTNGALQNIFLFSALGRWSGIAEAAIQVLLVFISIYLFGNLFCGWICHKGAVQEFLFRSRLRLHIPQRIDRWLQNIKYVLLILIIFWPIIYHQKLFLKLDPFKALFNLEGSTFLLIFGGVVLISSLFFYRPFCRYICPFGAAAGIINRFGLFRLKMKRDQACSGCTICVRGCLAGAIRPQRNQEIAFDAANCNACGECRAACKKMTC